MISLPYQVLFVDYEFQVQKFTKNINISIAVLCCTLFIPQLIIVLSFFNYHFRKTKIQKILYKIGESISRMEINSPLLLKFREKNDKNLYEIERVFKSIIISLDAYIKYLPENMKKTALINRLSSPNSRYNSPLNTTRRRDLVKKKSLNSMSGGGDYCNSDLFSNEGSNTSDCSDYYDEDFIFNSIAMQTVQRKEVTYLILVLHNVEEIIERYFVEKELDEATEKIEEKEKIFTGTPTKINKKKCNDENINENKEKDQKKKKKSDVFKELNNFVDIYYKTINKFGGCVHKILDNGVMVSTFNASTNVISHSKCACEASIELIKNKKIFKKFKFRIILTRDQNQNSFCFNINCEKLRRFTIFSASEKYAFKYLQKINLDVLKSDIIADDLIYNETKFYFEFYLIENIKFEKKNEKKVFRLTKKKQIITGEWLYELKDHLNSKKNDKNNMWNDIWSNIFKNDFTMANEYLKEFIEKFKNYEDLFLIDITNLLKKIEKREIYKLLE